jgi:hypothetical protein
MELRTIESMHAEAHWLPELFVVESHYRQAMLTAELSFVTELADRIRSGSFGGVKVWQRIHELREQGMPFEQIMSDPVQHLGEEARILLSMPHGGGDER